MTVVHEEPITVRYSDYGDQCTLVVYIVFLVVTIVVPFIIVLFTGDFWRKHNSFHEKATVSFENKILLEVLVQQQGKTQLTQMFWTSNANVNEMMRDKLIFPTFTLKTSSINDRIRTHNPLDRTYKHFDANLADQFQFDFKIPLANDQEVVSIRALLFFDYKLKIERRCRVEALAHLYYSSPIPGDQLSIYGDLLFKQTMPIRRRYGVKNKDINGDDLIDFGAITNLNQINIDKLLEEVSVNRELTATFSPTNTYWRPKLSGLTPTPSSKLFHVKALINVPAQVIWYEPGVLEVVKWAWVQYMSLLLVFLYVTNKIFRLLVVNGTLKTRMQLSSKKMM